MPILYLLLSVILLLWSFYAQQSKLNFIFLGLTVWSLLSACGAADEIAIIIGALVAAVGLVLQYNASLRRSLITDRLFDIAAKVLPRMSETEKTALEAGTVWFDGDIFSGRPDWEKLKRTPAFKLSDDEQSFVDGPVKKLCEMLDDWQVQQDRDLPPAVWDYLNKEKFFGLVIPKEYGGLGFSASGHSAVVTRIATRSIAAAVTVMVPNSLGPGELLLHYGTDEQKKNYLPNLANGKEIPCFALTGPEAGSDAGAMQSYGTVVKKKVGGKTVLGVSLDFKKRYITLAPIATLIGLAFKLRDPDHLLSPEEDRGITCALLPRDIKGLIIGNRHDPMGVPFANGPIQGKNIFIPISSIIGGEEGIGNGWRMLVESLAAGRSISLPSMSVGAAQLSTRVCGAYATIREQFDTPIGRFEGVEELLARIAGYTYMMDATRKMTCTVIDMGEKPSVLSGTVKAYLTEGMRQTLNDAMDLRAGAAIIRGPQNILSRAYAAIPIGITVEGSNVLTRSMIIYGQGAIRSHPFLLKEMTALQTDDKAEFDEYLWKHVFNVFCNGARSFILGLAIKTGVVKLLGSSVSTLSQSKLTYLCSAFSFVSDIALATYGGALKRKETVSGRFADAFSWIYLASASLKRYGDAKDDSMEPILNWCVQKACHEAHEALRGNIDNLPNPFIRFIVKIFISPIGLRFSLPDDKLMGAVAGSILDGDKRREKLSEDVFVPAKNDPALGRLEHALNTAVEILPIKKKLRSARKEGKITSRYGEQMITEGIDAKIITSGEGDKLRKYDQLLSDVVAVDDFDPASYVNLK
jgi:acyl-CoA dehydrogenase